MGNLGEAVTGLRKLKEYISEGHVSVCRTWMAMSVAMQQGMIYEVYLKRGVDLEALKKNLEKLKQCYTDLQSEQALRRLKSIGLAVVIVNKLDKSNKDVDCLRRFIRDCDAAAKRALEAMGFAGQRLGCHKSTEIATFIPLLERYEEKYRETQPQQEGCARIFVEAMSQIAVQQLLREAKEILREIWELEERFEQQCKEIQEIHADFMELMGQLGLQCEAEEVRGQSDGQMMSDNQVASEVARTSSIPGAVGKAEGFVCASGQADEQVASGYMHAFSAMPATGLQRSDLP